MLIKIFSYLPKFDNVSLVNKLFYDVARTLSDPKICLTIGPLMIGEDIQPTIENIEETERNITKLEIDMRRTSGDGRSFGNWEVSDAVKIIRKFSATIKHFELSFAEIKMSDFVHILSLLPNVEHLNLSECTVDYFSHCQRRDECLILHDLKTLELYSCSQILYAFSRMPEGTLKKIVLSSIDDMDVLAGFITRQYNIKDVWLDGSKISPMLLDCLELESLDLESFHPCNESILATILTKQTKLKTLCVYIANDRLFNVRTSVLGSLEKLTIRFNLNSVKALENLSKLKQLKHLTIYSEVQGEIEVLAALDNSHISQLNLVNYSPQPFPMTNVHTIGALAKSAPNLTKLQFEWYCQLKIAAAIMQNFNFLEGLDMKIAINVDGKKFNAKIDIDRCINPKLTILKITHFPINDSLCKKLIKIYPNVKELSLCGINCFTTSQLTLILDGLQKIEFLKIESCDKMTNDHLNSFVSHKNKFNSIKITTPYMQHSAKQQLNAAFDFVRVYRRGFEYGWLLELMKTN